MPGREQRLHPGLAGLEVLAGDGHAEGPRRLDHARQVHRQVRRAVGVRHAALQRRVRVDLARRDVGVVVLQALLEGRQRLVHRRRLLVGLGRPAPHHHETVAAVLRLERRDVVDERQRLVPLRRQRLDAHALEPRHPAAVEHGRHRHDGLEFRGDRREVGGLEHAGRPARLERVDGERVPAAEDDVVEAGQRHEVANPRVALRLARAQADVGHLAQRPDGRLEALAGGEHAGDEGRGHGTHAGQEDAERAGGGSDVSSGHAQNISAHS